jgi:hypothetical protein
MSMTHDPADRKCEIQQKLSDTLAFLQEAFEQCTALHEVERGVWKKLLEMGRLCLTHLLALHGSADLGATVTLPSGEVCQRLDALHGRRYVSIFGSFQLERTVYGSREGQQHAFVPLDNRLQLPASDFSYLLQDWDQNLCVEQAFGQVQAVIARILDLQQPVDSLEHMNREMAQQASPYILNRPTPPACEEGALAVGSADGKGIVLRRAPEAPAPPVHRTKGEKASKKRMATVGTMDTVDRYVRTPEQVLAALFREGSQAAPPPPQRQPCHKQVWASLPQDDGRLAGQAAVFTWLDYELRRRNPGQVKETVYLCDGQDSLWCDVRDRLPVANARCILDILHVTPRLWRAAHVFYAEGSKEAEAFVRARVLRVLRGQAAGVIRGLRALATRRGVRGSKKKAVSEICNYLTKNLERMRYDEYLAAGYPIASGVIEGACRHLVKDRMERAGMHWTPAGAQAMLDLRSIFVSGQWEPYQAYRIALETQRLYPHRQAAEPNFSMAS